jgi:mannose-6-phosphate isomerase-like protein (cupin superfamily)
MPARRGGRTRPEHVPKPWGHETIWAHTERYVGKILHVNKGESLSLQYHRVKDETIRVLAGALSFEVGRGTGRRRTVRIGPGGGWHITPGTRHRMTALEDTDILEVSTPELDDVVRLEDRYGRASQGGRRPRLSRRR